MLKIFTLFKNKISLFEINFIYIWLAPALLLQSLLTSSKMIYTLTHCDFVFFFFFRRRCYWADCRYADESRGILGTETDRPLGPVSTIRRALRRGQPGQQPACKKTVCIVVIYWLYSWFSECLASPWTVDFREFRRHQEMTSKRQKMSLYEYMCFIFRTLNS